MAFSEYDDYDAMGMAALVKGGEVTPQELLDEAVRRIERINPKINAVVNPCFELAQKAVDKGLPDGAFQGVPFLLKDLEISMSGAVNSNGSAAWHGHVADFDSTLVERYKAAGLVIVGRSNSPELGLNPVTEPTEHGIARNPWNLGRTPGGSSGGAAAAVAAGIVPVAHATDGAGSIRMPSSCCGLFGLKPSRGRIPYGPDRSEVWGGMSTGHVISRSVRDSALMLDATAGDALGGAYSAPHHNGSFLDASRRHPGRLRIGVCTEKLGTGDYSEEVLRGLDITAARLQELGHSVEEVVPSIDAEAAEAAGYTVICVDTYQSLRRRAAQLNCTLEQLAMEGNTRITMELGQMIGAADYADAIQVHHQLGREMGALHRNYDVLLMPTMASPPIPVGYLAEVSTDESLLRLQEFMGNTTLFNQTGQPSMSVPLHWGEDGLPVGMMFSAAYGNDALLFSLAGQLELAYSWSERRPPVHAGE